MSLRDRVNEPKEQSMGATERKGATGNSVLYEEDVKAVVL